MGESRPKRRSYDEAFKREAVRLVLEEGIPAAQVERELGTGKAVVARWVKELTEDPEHAFPGKGRLKLPEEELRALKRELERVKRERDILKKAVAIFSTDPDRYTRS
jgi:transposase